MGLCGQAPSDDAAFARFLVEQGINSITFEPGALINGITNIREAERLFNPVTTWNHDPKDNFPWSEV